MRSIIFDIKFYYIAKVNQDDRALLDSFFDELLKMIPC